jgi:hypothetical protein
MWDFYQIDSGFVNIIQSKKCINERVSFKGFDEQNNIFYEETLETPSKTAFCGSGTMKVHQILKTTASSLNNYHKGRIRIELTGTTPSGKILTDTVYFAFNGQLFSNRGIFGVVVGQDDGSVKITPLTDISKNPITTNLIHGAFWAPEFQEVGGKFKIEIFGNSGILTGTKYITKDNRGGGNSGLVNSYHVIVNVGNIPKQISDISFQAIPGTITHQISFTSDQPIWGMIFYKKSDNYSVHLSRSFGSSHQFILGDDEWVEPNILYTVWIATIDPQTGEFKFLPDRYTFINPESYYVIVEARDTSGNNFGGMPLANPIEFRLIYQGNIVRTEKTDTGWCDFDQPFIVPAYFDHVPIGNYEIEVLYTNYETSHEDFSIIDNTRDYIRITVNLNPISPITIPNFSYTYPAGWNMVAFPNIICKNPADVIVNERAMRTLTRYNSWELSYQTFNPDTPEEFGNLDWATGYWVNFSKETNITYSVPQILGTRSIYLDNSGWHMMGIGNQNQLLVNNPNLLVENKDTGQTLNYDQAVLAGWIGWYVYGYLPSELRYTQVSIDGPPIDEDNKLTPWNGYWMYTQVPNLELIIKQ